MSLSLSLSLITALAAIVGALVAIYKTRESTLNQKKTEEELARLNSILYRPTPEEIDEITEEHRQKMFAIFIGPLEAQIEAQKRSTRAASRLAFTAMGVAIVGSVLLNAALPDEVADELGRTAARIEDVEELSLDSARELAELERRVDELESQVERLSEHHFEQ